MCFNRQEALAVLASFGLKADFYLIAEMIVNPFV